MADGAEAAAETTKQIVTLATAVIGLTVTFADEFRTVTDAAVPLEAHWSLKAAWLAHGIAIVLGVWTLMAITGIQNAAALSTTVPDANATSVRIPALLMIVAFAAGMIFVIVAGFVRFG
jgi:hypothetical protein